MGCYLHVSGDFEPGMFLSQSPWAAVGVWQRGDAWKEGHFHEHAGFTVYISEAPFNAYEEQFKDATDFLRHFGDELARLGKAATQIEVTLCFGMAQKNALDWGIVIPNLNWSRYKVTLSGMITKTLMRYLSFSMGR